MNQVDELANNDNRKVDKRMEKSKLLKLMSGIGIGIGVGTCLGVAMDNILVGFLLGIGVGLCYAIGFGAFKSD